MGTGTHVPVAVAHDYLTQAGGAERVVLDLAKSFPGAPIYTNFYHAAGTFPEFSSYRIRTTPLNRIPAFRRDPRLALPILAPNASRVTIDAEVTIASSSGWAHGFRTTGRMVVYCHTPARWLYQTAKYIGGDAGTSVKDRARKLLASTTVKMLKGRLQAWDRRAAANADKYLVNSTVTQQAVKDAYGIDAEIIPPPPAMWPDGPQAPVDGLEPGFLLCVARLLPYKNVDYLIDTMHLLPRHRLVVVGGGPDMRRLTAMAEKLGAAVQEDGTTRGRVSLLGRVSDAELRWLYARAGALVAASYEDYGLTPLEAAMFGKPTVAMRAGGYLDTVDEGTTGIFFDDLTAPSIAEAIQITDEQEWQPAEIMVHADRFSPKRFHARIRNAVLGVSAGSPRA